MCTASSDDIAQRQMFQVRGAPEIEHTTTNKNLMEGESAVLKCDLLGFPVPAIKWQKQNVESDETSDVVAKKGKIEFSVHRGVKDAMISISDLDDSDSGVYACTADNGMGSASFNITLRVKDKLAALWPFLGIVVEVLVLVTVIFIYEKRRSPKDEAVVDEEDDEEEQKKALTTGETVDVRQRGVKS
jgi:basigin